MGADGEPAAFPRDQIDAEFLVPEGGAQRTRQIKIAAAGLRVDVGGAAAAVAPVDAKQPFADPDVAADPIEFFPGPGAVDIEIGPKPQRIDLDTPLFSRLRTVARLISEMTLSGLSMKCPSRERTSVGATAQGRQQAARKSPRPCRARPRH